MHTLISVLDSSSTSVGNFKEFFCANLIKGTEGEGEVSYLVTPQRVTDGQQSFFLQMSQLLQEFIPVHRPFYLYCSYSMLYLVWNLKSSFDPLCIAH